MPGDSFKPATQEQLREENDFLKMKLMLERGAKFGNAGNAGNDEGLPPEIENDFLNHVIEFEKQWENSVYIKVFDKIGRPSHFIPADQIPDEKIEEAWAELSAHLHQHSITLDVCSPNVSAREMYRFTIEELFEHEMQDINIPGMISGFIYDEFHPDIAYDNTRTAVNCIEDILSKEPLEWVHHYARKEIQLNEHHLPSLDDLKLVVNRYKEAYDSLVVDDIHVADCIIDNADSSVSGTYALTAITGCETFQLSGNWKAIFKQDSEFLDWSIVEIILEGISF